MNIYVYIQTNGNIKHKTKKIIPTVDRLKFNNVNNKTAFY